METATMTRKVIITWTRGKGETRRKVEGGKTRREEKDGKNDAEGDESGDDDKGSRTTRGAEGRDDKEGGDDEGGEDAEGGVNENEETRQVEGRTMEQIHMDLLLIYLFFVYTCT